MRSGLRAAIATSAFAQITTESRLKNVQRPATRPLQPRIVRIVSPTQACRCGFTFLILLVAILLLGLTPNASAQLPQLVPLVTDQTPMGLSDSFGVPSSAILNQRGDYAFLGNSALAVFLRLTSAPAPARILQVGDEIPGFPGSRVQSFGSLRLNNSGLLAFQASFALATGEVQSILLSYDGALLQKVVYGGDTIPGSTGTTFGSLLLRGLNDSGAVAFTAGSQSVFSGTLYIVLPGGIPVRVAGLGDTPPGTTGTFSQWGTFVGPNNSGEVLIIANISGGAGGSGQFVGSTTGMRKVVVNGDLSPLGGNFTLSTGNTNVATGLLNNLGQVAFIANNSLWVNSPSTGTSAIAAGASAAPAALGGVLNFFPPGQFAGALVAFDDAGEIASSANLSGSSVTSFALFRFHPQQAAGSSGLCFRGRSRDYR